MARNSMLIPNLRAYMSAQSLSEKALAEAAGMSQPTLNRILRGESSDPRDSTLEPLASHLGVDVADLKGKALFGGYAPPPPAPAAQRTVKVHAYEIRGVDGEDGVDPATDAMISIYDIEVSAGAGAIVPEFVETRYRLPYQIDWLRRWDAAPEDILVAKVRGDSMEPVLYDGDKVVIHRGMTRIAPDCTYALIYESAGSMEARVKRLRRLGDGRLLIQSNNPDKTRYPDETALPGEVCILGRVIDKMGSGGL